MGLAWVPASVMQLQRPGVAYRPLAGASLQCETSLVWKEPGLPVVRRFVAHVQAQLQRPGAAKRRQSPAIANAGAR
jgi:hypothetical protein